MVQVLPSPLDAGAWCLEQRKKGKSLGYVPTMGALHEGHISLVERAVLENTICCASIFVNPLQFNNPEDLRNYPATFKDDIRRFENAGCDMVFTGTLKQFFPELDSLANIRHLDPGPCSLGLEGEYRPGHLEGVITIVDRLFRTVGNCAAYFGEKDYQQTLVVRFLSENLKQENLNIDVIVCPTIREESGLAMSSRNQRLTGEQHNIASLLNKGLKNARQAWQSGEHSPGQLEKIICNTIKHPQIIVEYVAVRDENKWTAHTALTTPERPRALVAANIGAVRLIDNLALY
jgi:pantoate--beta-alanine ligase